MSRFNRQFTSGDIWLKSDEQIVLLMAGMRVADSTVRAYDWEPPLKKSCPVSALNLFDEPVVYALKTNLLYEGAKPFDPFWQVKMSDLLGVTHLVYFEVDEVETEGMPLRGYEQYRTRVNITFYDVRHQTIEASYEVRTSLNPVYLPVGPETFDTAVNLGSVDGAVRSGLKKAFRDFNKRIKCRL